MADELDIVLNPAPQFKIRGEAGRRELVELARTQTLTNKTLTAPVITAPVITGAMTVGAGSSLVSPAVTGSAGTGFVIVKKVAFVEDATSVTHTGTVPIPAGATIHDIIFTTTVLWADTASTVIIGDSDDPDGYFASTDLDATDLLVGEVFSIHGGVQTWGGKLGVYLVSATGRMGSAVAGNSGLYYGVANSIIAVVAVTTPSGTAGRSFLTVAYSVGETIAAVSA